MYLRATASYTDKHGSGKSAMKVSSSVMPENTAPAFSSETTTRMVEENTAAGTNIGDPVAATDADNDTLAYALSGTDAASFDIDSASGQIMTKADLDHEAKDTYTVMVTATDPDGETDSVTVTINVTDVAAEEPETLFAALRRQQEQQDRPGRGAERHRCLLYPANRQRHHPRAGARPHRPLL